MGFKIWNFKLKGLELSFLHHSIRLEIYIILMPKKFTLRKKMAELWPFKALAPMWHCHLAYFWPIIGNFGQILKIWTLFLFCPSFRSTLMGKSIFRPNGAILTILSPKNPQKTLKWPYLQTRSCPNCNYQRPTPPTFFNQLVWNFGNQRKYGFRKYLSSRISI